MFKKYHQLVVGKDDIQILELHYFFIPSNFIRIKVHYSAISVGSESTTLKSKSILEARKNKDFFAKLREKFLSRRLYITLKKMIKTKSSFGYSLVGEVVGLGNGVSSVNIGDFVVATGEFASHASYVDVPQGFVFKAPSPDPIYSFSTLAAIAINGVQTILPAIRSADNTNFSELSVQVVGGGSIGLFAGMFLQSLGANVTILDINHQSVGSQFFCGQVEANFFDLVIWTAPNIKGLNVCAKRIKLSGAIAFIGEIDRIDEIDILRDQDLMIAFGKSSGLDRANLKVQITTPKTIPDERTVSQNMGMALKLLSFYQEEIIKLMSIVKYDEVSSFNFRDFGKLQAIDWK